jgi:hypothetical protein
MVAIPATSMLEIRLDAMLPILAAVEWPPLIRHTAVEKRRSLLR